MIHVMIADDHALIRQGLRWVVSEQPDMSIACEAELGEDIIPLLKSHEVDVLLLDITMPGSNFLDTMRRVKLEKPAVNILVISIHSEEIYALRALDAGAKGYLNKQRSSEELPAAIRQAHKGDPYVTPALAKLLVENRNQSSVKPLHEKLTDREYTIMCLLGSGKRIKTIAEELSLSPKTVSSHQANILRKMHLDGPGDLIHYTIKHELSL